MDLIEQFKKESRECGVIGAVAKINALYIGRSANPDAISKREESDIRKFAEYLRDEVFSKKENYNAMMDNWGQEPFIMRYAGVKTNSPLSLVKKEDLPEDEWDDDELFDEDFDEDFDDPEGLFIDDIIDERAEELFHKIYLLDGDLRFTYVGFDADVCTLEVDEPLKELMEDAIICFLGSFIFSAGSLTLSVQSRENDKKTVYGFRADGEDWYPVSRKELKKAYETDPVTGASLPPIPGNIYRELRKD